MKIYKVLGFSFFFFCSFKRNLKWWFQVYLFIFFYFFHFVEVFEPFLKAYIEEFKFKSINTNQWKKFLFSYFQDQVSYFVISIINLDPKYDGTYIFWSCHLQNYIVMVTQHIKVCGTLCHTFLSLVIYKALLSQSNTQASGYLER